LEPGLLFYNQRPTKSQSRIGLLVAVLGFMAFVAIFPVRMIPLAKNDAFIPIFDTALFLGGGMTAILLFAQASVLRSKALIALGTGYFFTSLMAIPHVMTFPWAFSTSGLLGAGLSTNSRIYQFWHIGLPISVIAYTLLRHSGEWLRTSSVSPRKAIAICLVSATISVVALTVFAIVGESFLPKQMWDPIRATGGLGQPGYPVLVLIAVAMAMNWRGRRSSLLDLWLMVVLWGSFLEVLAVTLTPIRFSLGWYLGRMTGLVSDLFVLLMLLADMSRVYAQAVLQFRTRESERENQLLIRDTITASIGHELRQPLAAIMLNAQAGQHGVSKPEGAAPSIFDDIVSDCHRANSIIVSTREMFGQSPTQKSSANMNQLISDTLALVSRDLRGQSVSVDLKLDSSLPPIAVNRLQMEQAFFNLFRNAAEAMSTVIDRPRLLTIRSSPGEDGLVIRVEDTGPGIDAAEQDRIFEPFFTTKKHGTGMGLAICRSVVGAHGGTIRIAASSPLGTTFEIFLPYERGTQKEHAPMTDPAPSLADVRLPGANWQSLAGDSRTTDFDRTT
jgi:signal transduction histidine kinase